MHILLSEYDQCLVSLNKIHSSPFQHRGCVSETEGKNIFILKPLCELWLFWLPSTKEKRISGTFFKENATKLRWALPLLSLKPWQKGINTCPDVVSLLTQTHRGWAVSSGQPLCHKSHSLSDPRLFQALRPSLNWRAPALGRYGIKV